MKIGVVSDTHGSQANTQNAVIRLTDYNVSAVLHCGDLVSASLVPMFAEWPTHFVFGNCDHHPEELRATIQKCGQTCWGRFGELELDGKKIAFLHSDDHQLFEETIKSGRYDLVCYGHTHQAESHYEGKTLVLNPGALYRADPLSFAVVDLQDMSVEFIQVPKT